MLVSLAKPARAAQATRWLCRLTMCCSRLPRALFVHSQSRTNDGIWVGSMPATLLPVEIDAAALGAAAAEALAASGSIGVPNYSAVNAPVLKVAGMKSWSKIQRNAQLCLLSRTNTGLVIQPTRNGGAAGDDRGFHELPGQGIDLAAPWAGEDLGRAILDGFSRCR